MYTTSIVIKVASRCNLNCTYCYVYNMGDKSYEKQPKFMSESTVESLLLRIRNHCSENKINRFLIIFHGGEPLLTGLDFYINFIKKEKEIIPKEIEIDYAMQTNGVLLTEEFAEGLKSLNIQVGISLDGTPNSNNKNRIYHNGKGSYEEITKGFEIIRKIFGDDKANCLCVIDTKESPTDVYNHFKKIKANNIHLLFQDFNYNSNTSENIPKIGDWLIEIFELWKNDNYEMKPNIRPINDLLGLLLGQNTGSEIFGKKHNQTLVVETDGSIETVDTLKICGDGFTKTNFNVKKDDLSEIYKNSEIARLYYYGHENLCDKCKNCPIQEICGGGYLGHRYSTENGFNNPSIYCNEIIKIICHLQNYILSKLSPDIIKESGIIPLNYREISALN